MSEVDLERARIERQKNECVSNLGKIYPKWAEWLKSTFRSSAVGNQYAYYDWQDEKEGTVYYHLKLVRVDTVLGVNYPKISAGITLGLSCSYWRSGVTVFANVSGTPRHWDSWTNTFWHPLGEGDDTAIKATIVEWLARDSPIS